MKIDIIRTYSCKVYTVGHLYVDGERVCDTIEDTDRGLRQDMTLEEIRKIKVYRQTAIPTGTYRLTMNVQSPKFAQIEYYKKFCNGYMPRILNVPGFDGILIHRGSSAASSAGCILVGINTIKGRLTSSQKYFETLMRKYLLPAKILEDPITITISSKY